MTAVCSVGLDMIAIPGDTPKETISAMIADEAAIGMINNKTTAQYNNGLQRLAISNAEGLLLLAGARKRSHE